VQAALISRVNDGDLFAHLFHLSKDASPPSVSTWAMMNHHGARLQKHEIIVLGTVFQHFVNTTKGAVLPNIDEGSILSAIL